MGATHQQQRTEEIWNFFIFGSISYETQYIYRAETEQGLAQTIICSHVSFPHSSSYLLKILLLCCNYLLFSFSV